MKSSELAILAAAITSGATIEFSPVPNSMDIKAEVFVERNKEIIRIGEYRHQDLCELIHSCGDCMRATVGRDKFFVTVETHIRSWR